MAGRWSYVFWIIMRVQVRLHHNWFSKKKQQFKSQRLLMSLGCCVSKMFQLTWETVCGSWYLSTNLICLVKHLLGFWFCPWCHSSVSTLFLWGTSDVRSIVMMMMTFNLFTDSCLERSGTARLLSYTAWFQFSYSSKWLVNFALALAHCSILNMWTPTEHIRMTPVPGPQLNLKHLQTDKAKMAELGVKKQTNKKTPGHYSAVSVR